MLQLKKITELETAKWKEYDKALTEKRYPFSIRFKMLELQEEIERRKHEIHFHTELQKERVEFWSDETKKINEDIINLCKKQLKALLKRAGDL